MPDQVDLALSRGVKRVRTPPPTGQPVSATVQFPSNPQDNQDSSELVQRRARRQLLSKRLERLANLHHGRTHTEFSCESTPHDKPAGPVAAARPLLHPPSPLPEHELPKKLAQSETTLPPSDDCRPRTPQLAVSTTRPHVPSVIQRSSDDEGSELRAHHSPDFSSQADFNPWEATQGSMDDNQRLSDCRFDDRAPKSEPSEEDLSGFLVWIKSQNMPTSTFQSRLQHLTSARTNQLFIERHALLNFKDIRHAVQGVYEDLVAAEEALENFIA